MEQPGTALLAVLAAVAVTQVFHLLGAASGLGTALGEAFLPMHLPVILVGLLAGPYEGGLSARRQFWRRCMFSAARA